MKKLILVIIGALLTTYTFTQGCVAIRNVAGISPDLLFENVQPNDKIILNISNRYFSASSTFRGDKYITDTLVTNKIYTLNISVLRIFDHGWSLGLNVPVAANSRRNYADHGGFQIPKHTTNSFGLGDIRLTVYKWLMNSAAKGNIQLGFGIKLPTGDYKYQDYFYRKVDSSVLAPVDQAIQPGDGGTGFTTELNAFYSLAKNLNLFFQGYYLVNPREQNGVSNLKGRNPTPTEVANYTTVMSVPDQYSFRGGVNYEFQKFVFTGAVKYEKVPANDLIGGNKGFRRAATVISVEPGATYRLKNTIVFVYTGIPFQREIEQNTENNMTPAGFADCVFTFGIQFKL